MGAHLRRISAARILIDAGKGGDELMKICGLKDYAARKTHGDGEAVLPRFCRQAADLVLETDSKLKTSL